MFHSLIATGSPRMPSTVKLSENGILTSFAYFYHPSRSSFLYFEVKGATYEMYPAARMMFPTKLTRSTSKTLTVSVHLVASSANPTTSFSALMS